MLTLEGGKRPLPFLLAKWGSGGRRFESSHSDFELGISSNQIYTLTQKLVEEKMTRQAEFTASLRHLSITVDKR